MRIATFSNTYLPTVSGVVRSISSYKKALEELGHEVHVFTQGARGYQDQEGNIHRYYSFHFGLPSDLPITIPFSPSIDRLITEFKPDLIHSQHPFLLGNVARRKAHLLNVPLVYTLHSQYWHYGIYIPIRFLQKLYNKFIAQKIKRYLLGCDHIIVPSESMRNLIAENFHVKKAVSVIPTGIELKSYDSSNRDGLRRKFSWGDDFVIISTGRLAPEKNWPDLIRAADQVMKVKPETRLVILGDGPQKSELEQQAAALGIAGKMHFVGMVPFENVTDYLIASDLFAFTSLTETQGLGTLEALAAGLPVVAYDAIGTRDFVIDGVNGTLTSADSQQMVAAILNLINDPSRLEMLRQGALRTAATMDMRELASKLVRVYETSIAQFVSQKAVG